MDLQVELTANPGPHGTAMAAARGRRAEHLAARLGGSPARGKEPCGFGRGGELFFGLAQRAT